VYKVLNTKTGLFSSGTWNPKWTKAISSSSWKTFKGAKSHIDALSRKTWMRDRYDVCDLEIVECELELRFIDIKSAAVVMHEEHVKQEKDKKEREEKEKMLAAKRKWCYYGN
jgi:hypothetical protein